MPKSQDKTDTEKTEAPAMMSAMLAISPAAATAWMNVMTESARFVADRLQQDMKVQQDMLACRNPAELMKMQTEFYQNAVQQYMEEATRLMAMMTDATQSSATEMKSGHKRGYDDVPL